MTGPPEAPIEERKELLRDALDRAGCPRVVYLDHVIGQGAELFEQVRRIGVEGIVSKRLGSRYCGFRRSRPGNPR